MTVTDPAPSAPSSPDPGTDLERIVPAVVAEINKGSIKLSDLLKRIAKKPEPYKPPTKTPLPAVLTEKERQALETFHQVFGKVCPTERSAVTEEQLDLLVQERDVLDVIEKMIAKRKEAIRTIVFNHFDTQRDPSLDRDEDGNITGVEWDKDGFYILPERVSVPSQGKAFTREVSEGTAGLTEAKLRALDEQGVISHEDYLEMTDQTRVVNEAKVLLRFRKNPKLVAAIGSAIELGRKKASFHIRPIKS